MVTSATPPSGRLSACAPATGGGVNTGPASSWNRPRWSQILWNTKQSVLLRRVAQRVRDVSQWDESCSGREQERRARLHCTKSVPVVSTSGLMRRLLRSPHTLHVNATVRVRRGELLSGCGGACGVGRRSVTLRY